jgi:hypothetical protein
LQNGRCYLARVTPGWKYKGKANKKLACDVTGLAEHATGLLQLLLAPQICIIRPNSQSSLFSLAFLLTAQMV